MIKLRKLIGDICC